jgi:hypothetical protein
MPKQFRDVRIFPLQENLLVVVFETSFHHFSRSPRKLRLARTKDLSPFTCSPFRRLSFNSVRHEVAFEDVHPEAVHETIHDLDVLWARPAMFPFDGQRNHARDVGLRHEFRVRD